MNLRKTPGYDQIFNRKLRRFTRNCERIAQHRVNNMFQQNYLSISQLPAMGKIAERTIAVSIQLQTE